MSKKNKRAFTYIRKGTPIASSKPITQPQPVTIEKNYYCSIYKLPLSKFQDAFVDDNLYALVISGDPTKEELEIAWGVIRQQYADKAGDLEYKTYIKLHAEVSCLIATLNAINNAIEILRRFYTKQIADKLNRLLNTNYNFDIRNLSQYDKMLDRCHNQTGGLKMNLDLKRASLKNIEEKYKKNTGKPTRDYFISMLIYLGNSANVVLNDSITVAEYCTRLELLNKQAKKSKTRG